MSTTPNENQPKTIKDMSGYIAKNSNRTKDTQPHMRGKIRINGKEYLLSIWEKNGELMSVSVTDPEQLDANRKPSGSSSAPPVAKTPDQPINSDDLFGDIFT